ncbi:MAG: hypothetical protein WCT02_03250 [Candidatus Paceibacterota bacterium]
MESQSGIRTWQWVVTVIVILVLIIIGVMVFGGKGAKAPETGTETPSVTETNQTSVNRIVMSDQYPGNVVYLSSVQVSSPSWVVIQADDAGSPGKILGSARFATGINPGKITLSSPMIDGATYYAVIYSDNGDAAFDASADQPLKDANGNIIMKVFKSSSAVGAGLKG